MIEASVQEGRGKDSPITHLVHMTGLPGYSLSIGRTSLTISVQGSAQREELAAAFRSAAADLERFGS